MQNTIITKLFNFLKRNRLAGPVVGMASFIIIMALSFLSPYESFELRLSDLRFRLKPAVAAWNRITVIEIDEQSVTDLGDFPWTRNIYATGLDVLRDIQVEQAALDIIFPDTSPYQLNMRLLEKLRERKNTAVKDVETLIIDHDRVFAASLAGMNRATVAYAFSTTPLSPAIEALRDRPDFRDAYRRFLDAATIPVPEAEQRRYASLRDPAVIAVSLPISTVMATGRHFGFVDRDPDIDGTLRKIRLVRYYDGRLWLNLTLVMLLDICGIDLAAVQVVPGDAIYLRGAWNPATEKAGDIAIPIDRAGMMHINWAGRWQKGFNHIPFKSLVDYDENSRAVFDYFDEVEGADAGAQNSRISAEYRALREATAAWNASRGADRRVTWQRAREALAALVATERQYAAPLDERIAELKKLAGGDTASSRDELDAAETLRAKLDRVVRLQQLAGHTAITGYTATSSHDIGTIPLQSSYPGVGIYPNAVNTVLSGAFIQRAPWAVNMAVILLLALGMGFFIQGLDARRSLIAIAIAWVAVNLAVVLLFIAARFWIDMLGTNFAILFPSAILTATKFVGEESQKRFIKNAFSHYISPAVIEEILKNPEKLELGGESRTITIYFSDVVSFSTISEQLSPRDLVTLLNEYLSEMEGIIKSYKGTVDKYIGDAVMAFYGAPHAFPEHPRNACLAAIDMKKRLREMQESWRNTGSIVLAARMGMNTGESVVGNMGSRSRMDYTAMGDAVNLASRLEGANKTYGTSAIISESTYQSAADVVEARKLDRIRVIGKTEAIQIYELLGRTGSLPDRIYDMMEHYKQGMEYFGLRDWKQALKHFRDALKIVDDDGPSKTYSERCLEFIKKPPSKKWDGVYAMKTK